MNTLVLPPVTLRRFEAKIDRRDPTECWPWTGAVQSRGYGSFGYAGHVHLAHRVSFELAHRLLDPAETVDHLCFNQLCQNPGHLDPCSVGENVSRAWRAGRHQSPPLAAYNAAKTACIHGHEFDLFNTRWLPDGSRVCVECRRRRDRERLARLAMAAAS